MSFDINYYTNTVKQLKIVRQVVKVVNRTVKSKHCQHPLDILPLHGRLWSVITAVEAEEIWPDFCPPAFLGSSHVPVCFPPFLSSSISAAASLPPSISHVRQICRSRSYFQCPSQLDVPSAFKLCFLSFFLLHLWFFFSFHTAVGLCLAWGFFHNPK